MISLRLPSGWPEDKPENQIFVALIAIVMVGAGQGLLSGFDVVAAKPITELLAFAICVLLFPRERRARWTLRLVLGLVGTGTLLGAIWIAAVGYPERYEAVFVSWDNLLLHDYLVGVATGCIAAPLFEEKVVRHLLFCGLSHYVRTVFSIMAVSALFAWPHTGNEISAFIFSVILCSGVIFIGLDAMQRAIVHAAANFTIIHWSIMYASI